MRWRFASTVCSLISAALIASISAAASAQIAISKPLHIRHVQGYITDEKCNAVKGAEVELLRDGNAVLKTRADQVGWFQFDRANGKYILRASVGAPEAGREVVVGTTPLTLFSHKTLYVMIRTVSSCDDCSIRVFTSKRQLLNAVWLNTGHYN